MGVEFINKDWEPGDPFGGELMTCVVCGKQKRSNPLAESDWRAIKIDDWDMYYACPEEFLGLKASSTSFRNAYLLIMACIMDDIACKKDVERQASIVAYREARKTQPRGEAIRVLVDHPDFGKRFSNKKRKKRRKR